MSWYVVFQLEGDANTLVPSAYVLPVYLRYGYWPVRRLHMKFVRGGRRAWALARRWAVDGKWAEIVRVWLGLGNPPMPTRPSAFTWFVAQRTFIQRTS